MNQRFVFVNIRGSITPMTEEEYQEFLQNLDMVFDD